MSYTITANDLTVEADSNNIFVSTRTYWDTYIADKLADDLGKNWVMDHAEDINDIIAEGKVRKEQDRLKARQAKNKHLRGLVKHVHWSGNTCILYWNDGTQTKSHWNPDEIFDAEKAILVCMARKLYEDTNLYNEVLDKYVDEGYAHFYKELY